MATREPTDAMRAQLRIHLAYLADVQGWTKAQRIELVADYQQAMQTEEGFAVIEAHLASVTPHQSAFLAKIGRTTA
ncbi:hypothetical protein ACFONG_16040 [Uliginosibacterium paludis]|uniref:Uncharacterized protein n=1 Tax=Uliginosibacterium paludis TaxID=1615952 RepID=A0ABV2CUF7_9RHOO